MHPIVREQFPAFTSQFEGRVNTMYLDILGLVTVGVGCLIDTAAGAARLPFVHANGTVATHSEIEAAWHNLKAHQELSKLHWKYAIPYTHGLRLPDAAVDDLMLERMDQNDRIFAKTFDGWDEFPPEAQLALHSMGWAMGAGFPAKWGNLSASVRARDWTACAANCKIREAGNPGIVPRNKANKALFEAAAHAVANPLPVGITEDDRDRVERMTALWFYEQTGEPSDPEPNT
jgi:GH24 family phage-related lysozyme (muramidase)